MKTAIWIVVKLVNVDYAAVVREVKKEIIHFFGTRNITVNDEIDPVIGVSCEVCQKDITDLYKIIDRDYVQFVVIKGLEDSDRVSGDIIDLC